MGETAEPDKHSSKAGENPEAETRGDEEQASVSSEEVRQHGPGDSGEHSGSETRPTGNGMKQQSRLDTEQKMTAKFLMSNTAAGSIIGKAGANINELQRKSGAKLQLSRPTEFFPGTNNRVLSGTGTVEQLSAALTLILTACQDDASQRSSESEERELAELKFLAPSAVCGVLIGKSGSHIKEYTKESNANITVSNMHEQLPGVSERVVAISGSVEQIVHAISLILEKLQESRHYSRLANVPINYQPWGVAWPNHRVPINGMHAPVPMLPAPSANSPTAEAECCLQVPDASIGAIIGKGGEIITQIKNLFDVTIRISDRDSFVPGTRNREIVIRGAPPRVHLANQLIHEKLTAAEAAGGQLTSRRRQ